MTRNAVAMLLMAGISAGCAHYAPAPLVSQASLSPGVPAIDAASAGPLSVADVVDLAVRRSPALVAARQRRGVAWPKHS